MSGNEPKEQNGSSRKRRGIDCVRLSLIIFALAVTCLFTRYILCYLCGYYQTSFSLMGWNYLLAMSGMFLLLVLLIVWIASLFCREECLWTTVIFLALLLIAMLKFVIPWPHDVLLYGLK